MSGSTQIIGSRPCCVKLADRGEAPSPPDAIKGVVIMVTTPILFVYLLIQKYFVKGVLLGSVKGNTPKVLWRPQGRPVA